MQSETTVRANSVQAALVQALLGHQRVAHGVVLADGFGGRIQTVDAHPRPIERLQRVKIKSLNFAGS